MSYSKYLLGLMNQAKLKNKTIVLPEGEDERVLEAAHIIASEKVAKIVILGDVDKINSFFSEKGWNFDGIQVIKPETSPNLAKYTQLLFDLRKDKGLTEEDAAKLALNYNYFGTLMIKAGDADGMVSGADHSTADTVRPALQIIKSAKKGKSVSSFFLLVFDDKPYILSDCAIVINPTDREMADIALDAAESALHFGMKPKVAMLSYSTDAALDAVVAMKKASQSHVAGKANVLIFPSLEAGNISYKLLQRLGGCAAFGPVLQGLNAPVSDLSRGALVEDIVGVIAITCLQA